LSTVSPVAPNTPITPAFSPEDRGEEAPPRLPRRCAPASPEHVLAIRHGAR